VEYSSLCVYIYLSTQQSVQVKVLSGKRALGHRKYCTSSARLPRMNKFVTKQIAPMFELRKYRYMLRLPFVAILRNWQYSKTYTKLLCDLLVGNGNMYKIRIDTNILLNNNV
jgi:hypothetical protein